MATFGWAYINCSDSGSSGGGGTGSIGSIQFISGAAGSRLTSGSNNFTFLSASSKVHLTGTLVVRGTISASHYHIEDVTEIDASGSTFFGNTDDDIHSRTGSFYVASSGSVSASLEVNITKQQVRVDGFRGGYKAIAANNSTSSANAFIYGISAAGNVNFRLHGADDGAVVASASVGAVYIIKDEVSGRSGVVTVRASGSQTIDGAATYQLSGSYPAISLYSNGANWFVF
jgi:hypothetical protein